MIDAEQLPPELRLALAYTPAGMRPKLAALFAFEQRLARIVSTGTEPALAQMRLAWWRETLTKPVCERPQGDAVLDALGQHWMGDEQALIALVDSWEILVALEVIGPDDASQIASGRSRPYLSLYPAEDPQLRTRIRMAAIRYAMADTASHMSDPGERDTVISCGLGGARPSMRLPRALRGLGVLEALALRALERGGRPLMEGRGASLTALWTGLIGR